MIGNAVLLDEIESKFTDLDSAMNSFIAELMANPDFTDWLIWFNIKQMQEGERPDGSDIEKTPSGRQTSAKYEPMTKWQKSQGGNVVDFRGNGDWGIVRQSAVSYDKVTLLDEGDFYKSEKTRIAGQTIELFATDPKTDELISTWGDVIGVSEEHIAEFIEIIRPEFISFAHNYFER